MKVSACSIVFLFYIISWCHVHLLHERPIKGTDRRKTGS